MTSTDKIKSLLALHGFTFTDLAKHQNVTKQNISNKASNDSWSKKDLFDIAELTGTKLAFIDDKNDLTFVLAKPNKNS